MTKARCNPLWQPIPCPLSDIEGLESWLGDMAAQGLVPVTIGQNFARFRCSQPKAVRYRLNAKPAPETFLEPAPGTPDGEERALAQECGWYYVTAVGDFFLYACEDSDAPELNTDPQVQALSLRYAKRQVFAPAGLLAYWLVTFWVRYAMGVWHTPVIDFVELGWLSFCYLGLLAAALVSVVHNTVLLYRFSARLTRGAEPERHKNWRKGAGRYLVGRVLAALLFVLTIVWTFAGSAMEKSRHGSIPLEDYTAPLPFATLDDYAGQPTALDADAAPAASFVLVQRLPLAPTFIKYEAHGQAGANGLRGALYVEYYECITPQLTQTMYREGKTNGLHNFPKPPPMPPTVPSTAARWWTAIKCCGCCCSSTRRNRFPCRSLKRSAKADLLHRVNQLKPAKPAEFLYFFSIQNTKQTAPPPYLAVWGGGALLL